MRFVVKEFDNPLIKNISEKIIGIAIEDDYGLVFPSPLTNFIKREYINRGKSLNTQKNAAYAITRFFNYLVKNIEMSSFKNLTFDGLRGLNLHHGAAYITEISLQSRAGEKNHDYVKSDINYINYFYHWLKKENIPGEDYETKEYRLETRRYRKAKFIRENVFETNDIEVIYPIDNAVTSRKIKTFGENRDKLISQFINCARRIDSEIALGICLQIFAGLRRSEVINLMPSSIRWENKGVVIEVRDNQNTLFNNVSSHSGLQVKNPRDQIALCPDIVKFLYDEHLSELNKIRNLKNEALFINRHSKEALTEKAYTARFEKVKAQFLDELLSSGNQQDYQLLTAKDWSTHIGRGIFTNILLDLGLTATQIALARGDRSINSALHYVDEHTMIQNVKMAINNFRILL